MIGRGFLASIFNAVFSSKLGSFFQTNMQPQGKQHVCYYSNKCPWSKAFLTELKTTPWVNSFAFVCVDPGPTRPKLPAWLQKVPTLMIAGESEPRTDSQVMNWLYEMKLRNSSTAAPSSSTRTAGGFSAATPGEPEAFNMAEHTSFARGFGYSFQDSDTSTSGMGGSTIPGTFEFLNGASGQSQAQPSMAQVSQKSKKEQMFDAQMEEYKRSRDIGLPPGPPRV